MNRWLRENSVAMWLLTILRVYIGFKWITGGWEKLSSGGFDASGFLTGAIANTGGEHPSVQAGWGAFLQHFALPNVGLFNVLVPIGEFLVGLGLILGACTTLAALMGMVMNFAFLFSGTVSTNPYLLLAEIFIVVAGANAGKIGLDRWIVPYLRTRFFNRRNKQQDTLPNQHKIA
ncbi:thiosulfate dehydrogenase [quinone] large subunit [Paenibacillus sp. SORGH_AS306]|nr:thiosulfate dehydrogenase [quinone] large subunit [Paenibacillus sp. SORGH_AS_0306]MDR6109638.1 thiosulfate dehydrogenase [quinone] large subunit [Paenibacillus sp. SORGH_AS_0338]